MADDIKQLQEDFKKLNEQVNEDSLVQANQQNQKYFKNCLITIEFVAHVEVGMLQKELT